MSDPSEYVVELLRVTVAEAAATVRKRLTHGTPGSTGCYVTREEALAAVDVLETAARDSVAQPDEKPPNERGSGQVALPSKYWPRGGTNVSWSPSTLRAYLEAHRRALCPDAKVSPGVVLFLLDEWEHAARPGGSSPGTQPEPECVCGHERGTHVENGECYAENFVAPGSYVPCQCERFARTADWRESDVVKQARTMLTDIGSPLWPGLTESDWAEVLRGVLAERDFIGDWLQRCLDSNEGELLVVERDRLRRERDEAREKLDAIDPLCAHPSVEAALRELGGRVNAAEADREQLREALADNDRDARWIVGQWQRLQDEPVKEVASAIVERVRAALAATGATKEEDE